MKKQPVIKLMKFWIIVFKKFWILFVFLVSSFSLAEDVLTDLEASPESSSEKVEIKSVSDLQQITPYTSISVIQKRYLPKTFRGEFNLSFSATVNHNFFYLGGVSGRVGFFLREDHGFGVEGFAVLPPVFKLVTKDITAPPNQILPLSILLPQFYGGIYYKWSPIFGKFALLDKKIIYFDSYATIGGGMSKVLNGRETIAEQIEKKGIGKVQNKTPQSSLLDEAFPTLTFGIGQLFAYSQSLAFNWELKWFYTFAKYEGGRLYTPTDINFSLGVNYYFPGASYR